MSHMKQWKIGLLACLLVACMGAVLVGCQSATYTPESKKSQVPASALGQADTLRVGVNATSAPLAGKTSSSGKIVGIDVDVASYIADELGLKVEIVDVSTDFASALKDKKIDIALSVDASEDQADYWCSTSYLDTGVALFGSSTESAVPTLDSTPKIAAQSSSKSSWRVTNLFGDGALVAESDLKSAFEALAQGNARYVAADAVIGTYVSYSNGYSDKVVALMQNPSGYCVAVVKSNKELQSAVEGAVSKLVNGGVMGIIESKWLGQALDVANVTVVKGAADAKDDKKKSKKNKEESAEEQPADDQFAGEQPVDGQPTAEAPAATEQPAVEEPATEQSVLEQPAAENAAEGAATANEQSNEQPNKADDASQSTEEKPAEDTANTNAN